MEKTGLHETNRMQTCPGQATKEHQKYKNAQSSCAWMMGSFTSSLISQFSIVLLLKDISLSMKEEKGSVGFRFFP